MTGKWERCKYCRKEMFAPCSLASSANGCPNAHPDVVYADRDQHSRQYRRLLRNLKKPAKLKEARDG